MSQRSDTFAPATPQDAPGLRFQRAEDVYTHLPDVGQDIATRPRAELHCLDFVRQLLVGMTPEEALTFTAFALQPRHAIWWGHELMNAMPDILTDQDREMMALAAAWVAEPDDDHRRAAAAAGAGAQARSPGVWLAMAAGWSSGSMSKPDLPAVPVPPGLLPRALNACALTSLARVPIAGRKRMLDHYVAMGEALAKSG